MSIDRSLNIKITTTGDPSGAKAVQQSLKDVGSAASEGGQGMKKLDENQKDATESGHKLHEVHAAIHKIGHILAHETEPEFAEALMSLRLGPLGALAAIGFVFELIQKSIEGDTKKTEEFRQKLDEINTSVWDSQRAAIDKARDSADEFRHSLEDIYKENDLITEQEKIQLAILEAKLKVEEQLAKLKGQNTPEADAVRGVAGDQRKLDLQTQMLAGRDADQSGLQAAAVRAEAEKERIQADKGAAQIEPQLKAAQDRQIELDKIAGRFDVEALRQRYETASDAKNGLAPSAKEFAASQLKDAQDAVQAAKDNQTLIDGLQNQLDVYKEMLSDATKEAERTKNALDENTKVIKELTAAIKLGKAVLDVNKQGLQERLKLQFEHSDVGGVTGAKLEQDYQAEVKRYRRQPLTDVEYRDADEFEKIARDHKLHVEKLLGIMTGFLRAGQSLDSRINALQQALQSTQASGPSSGMNP